MSAMEETFIVQFHNLPGKTVKEKQINLFQLLRKNSALKNNQKELDFITAKLEPRNLLEKIFYVDFLIYFRRFSELYKKFTSGDDITIKKVSKHEWFYQSAYKDVDAEEFVSAILPTLSYSLKKKILRKLPVDENRADEVFDAIQKRYGTFLATDFLPKCSNSKICQTLKNNPVKLTQRQLQLLYKKDPNLIYVYFEERAKHEEDSTFLQNHAHILEYIAQRNPEMFANLFDKYKFELTLGRRTTKNYIISQKNKVANNLEDYIRILNNSMVVRKLGMETRSILSEHWRYLLKYYPKNQRFRIYVAMYDSLHRLKFGENVDMVSENELEIISDQKERQRIAKLKYEKSNEKKLLRYVAPEFCFEEFMGKINHLSYPERAEFVQATTECCIFNKDLDNLLKMCELVAVRFKNDEYKVRESFFNAFIIDTTIIKTFTEQHWNFIVEILEVADLNSEWISLEPEFRSVHVEFLIKNNLDIKDTVSKCNWPDILISKKFYKKPALFKPIINELIEIGCVNPIEYDKTSSQKYDCVLAYVCQKYNECNPNDIIEIYNHPRILKSAKEVLEQTPPYLGSNSKSGIHYIICRPSSSKELQELKNLCFKALRLIGTEQLMWFLKYEPDTVHKNIDQFLDYFGKGSCVHPAKLWRYFKKYSYLEFDKKIIEVCKLKLLEEGRRIPRVDFVQALIMLETPDSFLEFVKPYVPTSGKVDLTDKEVKDRYIIQTQIATKMHLLNSPMKILPTVLEFCKGDYLKDASSSLHSCIYEAPENETKVFIKKLNESKAVSVKKHGVNLSCVIYDVATVYDCLKNTTVPSLKAAVKYFAKNPSDTLWQLIETKISKIEKNDLHMCHSIIDIVVPVKYRTKYVEALWKLLDKYEDKKIKISLMAEVGKNTIRNLNSQFAFKIIRDTIFNMDQSDHFVASLLIYLNDEGKFEVFLEVLQKLKDHDWNRTETQRDARRKLSKFILALFEKYMEAEEKDEKFASKLLILFKSVFSLSETFEEHIVISSMAFKGESAESCSKLLFELKSRVAQTYSNYVIKLLTDTIQKYVFKHVFVKDNEQIELCHSIFKMRKSVDDDLLILALLPTTPPADERHCELYDEILKVLSESEDNVVQLQLGLYLRS